MLLLLGSAAAGSTTPAAEDPPDIRGTWRMELSLTTHAKIPVLGTTTIRTTSIYLVRITGSPDEPVQEQQVCSISPQASRSIAETTIPPAFIAAVPKKRFPLQLSAEDDGSWRVQADMLPQAIGYDPAQGSFPDGPDHPALVDFEGDGHPGATVHLQAPIFGKVQVYMAQRGRTFIDGRWDGRDEMRGGARVPDFAQRTVGASNRLFIANPELRTDPEGSGFTMRRVPEGTSCADLLAGLGAG